MGYYQTWRHEQRERQIKERRNTIIGGLITTVLLIGLLGLVLISSGCSVRAPGSRTFTFGPDGATITSETTTGDSTQITDVEKEKSVQVCQQERSKVDIATAEAAKDNPLVLAVLKQAETINNVVSLAITKKPYNPCASSTNSSDVEIADTEMYKSMFHDGVDLGKFLVGAWAVTDVSDSLFSALGKAAGGYTLSASGEGSSISVQDAFKESTLGDITGENQIGGILGNSDLPKTDYTNSFNPVTNN